MSARGHSSKVQIRLHVDSHIVRVAQVGCRSLILREHFECPPESEGHVVIVVDGHKTTYPIVLDNGINHGDREVVFSDVETPARVPHMPLFSDLDDVPF
jgi:hypothetical protein